MSMEMRSAFPYDAPPLSSPFLRKLAGHLGLSTGLWFLHAAQIQVWSGKTLFTVYIFLLPGVRDTKHCVGLAQDSIFFSSSTAFYGLASVRCRSKETMKERLFRSQSSLDGIQEREQQFNANRRQAMWLNDEGDRIAFQFLRNTVHHANLAVSTE